ncbi:hypothetical protein EYR41_005803 [Orbilia oligospora]|uniref:Uncharacterized protein n=1 Tax=Orbilia oligospora TaxID=2813651 RepID=A0A7C8TWM3_ORBOL|nr:hypothetical protein TWF751_004365 [Orbilia oligospora]TGJ69785.1 hypothetical protein EYR41_005803 [Orbilia oligospora]
MKLKKLWPFKKREKAPIPTRSEDITAMRGADGPTMLEIERRHLKRLKQEGASEFMIECQTKTVKSWMNSEKRRIAAEKARAAYEKSQARGRRQRAAARRWVNNISLFFGGDYVTPPEDPYIPAPGERVLFQHNGAIYRPERPDPSTPAQNPLEDANVWGSWDEQLSRQFAFPMEEAARIRAEIEHGSTEGSTVDDSADEDLAGGQGSGQAVRDGYRLYENLRKAERVLGEKIDISAYKLALARADPRPPTPPHMKPGWVMPPRAPGDPPLPDAAVLNGPKRPRANPYEKPTTKWSLPPFVPPPAPAPAPVPQPQAGLSQGHPHGEPLREEEFFRGRAAGDAQRASADSDALGAIEKEFLHQSCPPATPAVRPTSEVPTEGDFQGQVEFIPLNLTCSNPEEGMTLAEMLASEGLEDSELPPAARLIEVAKKPSLKIKGFGVSPLEGEQGRSGGGGRTFNEGGIDMEVYRAKRMGDPYRDSGITRERYGSTIDHEKAAEMVKTAKELGKHPEDTFKSIRGIRHRPENQKPKVGFVDHLQRYVAASEGRNFDFFDLHTRKRGGIKQSERYEEQQLKKRLEQRAREAQGGLPSVEETQPMRIIYQKPPTPKPYLAVAVEEKRPFDPANDNDGGIQLPTLSSYGSNNTQLHAFSSRGPDTTGEIQFAAPSPYEPDNTEKAEFPDPSSCMVNDIEGVQIPTLSSYGTQFPPLSPDQAYNPDEAQVSVPSPYDAGNVQDIQLPTLSSYQVDSIEEPELQIPSSSEVDVFHELLLPNLPIPYDDGDDDQGSYHGGYPGDDFFRPPHPEDLIPFEIPYTGLRYDSDDDYLPYPSPDTVQLEFPTATPFIPFDSMLFPRTCDVKRMVKPRGLETTIEPRETEVKRRKVPVLTVEGSASALLINAIVKVKNERSSQGDPCTPLKLLSPTPDDEIWIMKFNFDVILEAERLAKESGNSECVKSAVRTAARELGVELPQSAGTHLLNLRTWLMREYYESRATLKARQRREIEDLLELERLAQEKLNPKGVPRKDRNTANGVATSAKNTISKGNQSRLGSQFDNPGIKSQSSTAPSEIQPTISRPESQSAASRPESQSAASQPISQSTDSRPGSQLFMSKRQPRPVFGLRRRLSPEERVKTRSPQQITSVRNSAQSEASSMARYQQASPVDRPPSPTTDTYIKGIPEDLPQPSSAESEQARNSIQSEASSMARCRRSSPVGSPSSPIVDTHIHSVPEEIVQQSPPQAAQARNSVQSESSSTAHHRQSSLDSSPSSPTAEAYLHGIPEGFLREHAQMANERILESQVQPSPSGVVRRHRIRVRTRPAKFDVRDAL